MESRTPEPGEASVLIGQVLDDRYRVEEEIGRGGMGVVYRGFDTQLERPVALKFLPPELGQNETAKQALLREARAAAALEHANVAAMYEVGELEDGRMYLVMGYYDGETLGKRLSTAELSPIEVVKLAIQIAEGLAAAHQRQIVHRDIKPSNLMVSPGGRLRILDFGVAKLLTDTAVTREGTRLGSPAYMSPEQVRGEKVDRRTDIWALGVVLYQMVHGELPFRERDTESLMRAIVSHQPPSGGLSGPTALLERIALRALAKKPQARYSSAEEMLRDLRIVEHQVDPDLVSTRAGALGPSPRLRRLLPRVVPIVLLLTAAVIAVIAVVALRSRRAPPTLETVAVLPFANFTGDERRSYIATGIAAGLIDRLQAVPGVTVLGRSSAWGLEEAASSAALARRLGAAVLVEGEMRPAPQDRVSLGVRVTDGRSGIVLWSQSFDASADELFRLQEELGLAVTNVVSAPGWSSRRRSASRSPPEAKAFELYLRGIELLAPSSEPQRCERAAELFRQALRLDSSFAPLYVGLSEALWRGVQLGRGSPADLEQAESLARHALALDPDLPAAKIALARALRSGGHYTESIAEVRAVLATHPNPAEAQRELGRSFEEFGEVEAAEEAFLAAAAMEPKSWVHWNDLGAFYLRAQRHEDARRALEKSAELAPSFVMAPQNNLGALALYLGDFEGAIAAYEATGAARDHHDMASNLGTAYYYTGDFERAEPLYRRALELDPDNTAYLRNLGDVLERLGRHHEASVQYRRALRLTEEKLERTPERIALHQEATLLSAKAQECRQALARAESLRDVQSPETQLDLAMAYCLCSEEQQALEAARRSVELGMPGPFLRHQPELVCLDGNSEFEALAGEG